jgi:hypothetical protein
MGVMPILWIVWGGVAVILMVLLGYSGTLTRYEEDQIFLDDAGHNQAEQQHEILAKVHRIDPYVRGAIGAVSLISVGIIGMYIWSAVKNLS